jgi:hypothetical protein
MKIPTDHDGLPGIRKSATARLERARAGIQRALAQWDASDLQRLESSRKLLAGAVSDLRFFENAVRTGGIPHTAELRTTILDVKREVVQATEAVDAGVAFYRGLGRANRRRAVLPASSKGPRAIIQSV